jgi:hypothetical protein
MARGRGRSEVSLIAMALQADRRTEPEALRPSSWPSPARCDPGLGTSAHGKAVGTPG